MSLPQPSALRINEYPVPRDRSMYADAWFDPISSFPYFPLRPSQLQQAGEQETEAAMALEKAQAYPHAFVPSTAQGTRPSDRVQHAANAEQKAVAAALPIHMFDSPDVGLLPPGEFIKRASAAHGAVHALSRRYDTQVRFSAATALPQVKSASRTAQCHALQALARSPHLFAYFQGGFSWEPCTVLAYEEASEQFTIAWRDSGGQKAVKRLNLLFAGESSTSFRSRLQQARQRRAECESRARFKRYVLNTKFRNRGVNMAALNRRLAKLIGAGQCERFLDLFHAIGREIADDYIFAVKKGIILHEARSAEGMAKLDAAGVRSLSLKLTNSRPAVALHQRTPFRRHLLT